MVLTSLTCLLKPDRGSLSRERSLSPGNNGRRKSNSFGATVCCFITKITHTVAWGGVSWVSSKVSFRFMLFNESRCCFLGFRGVTIWKHIIFTAQWKTMPFLRQKSLGKSNSLTRHLLSCKLQWKASIIHLGNKSLVATYSYAAYVNRVCAVGKKAEYLLKSNGPVLLLNI